VLTLVVDLGSNHEHQSHLFMALSLLLGWSFAAAGLIALHLRPDNGTGKLLLAVCFTWFVAQFAASNDPVLFTIGDGTSALVLAVLVHLVLAYPLGRLASRVDRVIVGAGYALAASANVLTMLFDPHIGCPSCPSNVLLVHENSSIATAIDTAASLIAVVVISSVVVRVARRYRAATTVGRRQMRPIGLAGGAVLVLLVVGFASDPFSSRISTVFVTTALISLITVPYFFVAGLVRGRMARANVGQLLLDVRDTSSAAETEAALRRALNDPAVRLAAWVDERHTYVDRDGWPFDIPQEDVERVATVVSDETGAPLAAIVHDRALLEEPELLDAVTAAARLALQRNRLQTELQARLAELQREQDFIRDVVNAAPAFFLVLDYDGRIIRFNDTMAVACGIGDDPDAPDNVRGRLWWDVFVLPSDVAEVRRLTAAVAPGEHEHRFRSADGGEIVVAWSFTRVADSQGAPRLVVTGADVSERVRHEEELRRERDFLSIVGRATPTILCAVDSDGIVSDRGVNAAFTATTGVNDADAIGRPFWELVVPPEHVEGVRTAFTDAVLWGGAERHETPWRAAGGGELVIEWWVASLATYRHGNFLVVGNDVTKRKRDENELRRSRARLLDAADSERRRLERNLHDGAQQRLVSLSLALRLAEAKLRREPETAGEILRGAGEELALALQELRELARGLHPAVLTDRGLAAALEALAERSVVPVDLTVDLDDRLPEAVEVALYYVVSEALANVAKYAQASLVTVRVGRTGSVVGVEVVDDGIGGADATDGSGLLGLADRIEALDGRFVVASPPGEGTRIAATMPVSEVRQAVPQDAG
jgi:PAS domain S-box-containing protein